MRNELIFDNAGIPSIMVTLTLAEIVGKIPGIDCPAFVVNGKQIDEISISKYPNIIVNGRAYSLPLQQPTTGINFDEAVAACEAKGPGWHLMTAAEWGALANWCKANKTLPHGNDNAGRSYDHPEESGILYDSVRTLTGSGPATWAHDHTQEGIHDLRGNIFEWIGGVRWLDGELQLIPDNNAAAGADQSRDSKEWRPVKIGDSTLKYKVNSDGITLTTEQPDADWDGCYFRDMKAEIEVPDVVKALALYPMDDEHVDGYFWLDTEDERLAFRGGGWASPSRAGVFSLRGGNSRARVYTGIGFRSAYIRPSATWGKGTSSPTIQKL